LGLNPELFERFLRAPAWDIPVNLIPLGSLRGLLDKLSRALREAGMIPILEHTPGWWNPDVERTNFT